MDRKLINIATVLGNNIDTDQIYPGRFLELTDPAEIGSHCLSGIDPAIAERFPKGGIVVGGTNFGCGSSREHAVIALMNMGASAVVAESFARIFYRNAINLGLPVIICRGLNRKLQTGDTLELDLAQATARIVKSGETLPCEMPTGQARAILDAGGIKPLMRARFGKDPRPHLQHPQRLH